MLTLPLWKGRGTEESTVVTEHKKRLTNIKDLTETYCITNARSCVHIKINRVRGLHVVVVSLVTSQDLTAAKSLQSCPTLCDPRDDSPPGSPVPGILQARTLEWVAISFSTGFV